MTYRNAAILAVALGSLLLLNAVAHDLTEFALAVFGAGCVGYLAIDLFGNVK